MSLALMGLLGTILGVLGTVLIAVANNRASPYSVLAERVAVLETQVKDYHRSQYLLVEHVSDLHEWAESGAPPPPPSPSPELQYLFMKESA